MHKLGLGIIGILIITLLPIITVAGELSNASSFVIRNQDMEPHLKQNDTVMYSNSTSFDNLKVGDIIVFRAPEAKTEDGKPKVIVHRVAEIGNFFQKEVIRTRGDANPNSIPGIDYPLFKENYIGKVVSVTQNTNTTTITESKPLKTYEDQTVEEPRSFLKCYTSISTRLMLANMLSPYSIDLTDPDIKQFITNHCNFIHAKTGIWPLVTDDEPKGYGIDNSEFLSQYYPYGLPESVEKLKEIHDELSQLSP